jgi:hypothetical protein
VSHWDDMVRVAGSLATGQVRAHDLIRMMTAGGRSTGLGSAFAHYGRIFKTLHLLQVIHVEEYRRMIGAQLNTGESRQGLARRVYFGNLGRLTRGYERGMEDQLGALGLGLNAITWWNSLYIDAAVTKLEAGGLGISPEIRARLSPLGSGHINFHGSLASPSLLLILRDYPQLRGVGAQIRRLPAGCGDQRSSSSRALCRRLGAPVMARTLPRSWSRSAVTCSSSVESSLMMCA